MASGKRDWRAERARERRDVARIEASPDRDRIHTLLAGGRACDACGAYAVRYSAREGCRRCAECGAVNRGAAA